MTAPPAPQVFEYEAQSNDGQRLTGTLDALNLDAAMGRLQSLQLRVVRLNAAPAAPARGRALAAGDFLAFNQQFAQLTRAGLPVESGLRLIAGDLRRGRLERTVTAVADELERGIPLGEAFERYRGQFPSLYGRLIDAGVSCGNLPAVLLGLGKHLEMVQRLRTTLWRALAYPLMVMIGLTVIVGFLGAAVIPRFAEMFSGFALQLPWPTRVLLAMSGIAPLAAGLLLALVILGPLLWAWLRMTSWGGPFAERILIPTPLIGPVLRRSLAARWCDTTKIAVSAGLDLPTAIETASEASGSPALRRDGHALNELLAQGVSLSAAQTRLLPRSVVAAIDFASAHNDLEAVLQTLAEMYQRQAELRLEAIPAILTPILLILIASFVAFVLVGLLLPLLQLISGMAGTSLKI